jgi:hypothetical protein
MATITDDFTAADGNLVGGGTDLTWGTTYGTGTWTISSNRAGCPSSGDAMIRAEHDLDTPNHYAQVTTTGDGGHTGVVVRFSSSAQTGYIVRVAPFQAYIIKYVAGTPDFAGGHYDDWNWGAKASTDVLRAEIDASNTIYVYKNGVLNRTWTDSSSPITSGTRVGLFSQSGSAAEFDDFEAADFSAPGFTAVQDGAWNDTDTWGGTVPGVGDTPMTIPSGVDVEVTADTDVGDGTVDSLLTVNGTLTNTNSKFTFRGGTMQLRNSGGSGSASRLDVLIMNGTVASPAELVLDGNTGVTPTINVGAGGCIVANGERTGVRGVNDAYGCSIRTKATARGDASDSDGENAIITGESFTPSSIDLTGCDLYGLGASSVAAVALIQLRTADSVCILEDCRIDSCGMSPVLDNFSNGEAILSFIDTDWVNELDDNGQSLSCNGSALSGGGARNITGCYFEKEFFPGLPRDITFDGCFFNGGLVSGSGVDQWAAMVNCFIRNPGTNNMRMGGGFSGTFLLLDGSATAVTLTQRDGDATFADNVMQNTTGTAGASVTFISDASHNPAPRTDTLTGNVVLLDSAKAVSSGTLCATYGTIPADTEEIAKLFDHNTSVFKGTGAQSMISLNTGDATYEEFEDMVESCKSNLCVKLDSGGTGPFWLLNQFLTNDEPNIVSDSARASVITHNCTYQLSSVAADAWDAIGDNGAEEGTAFNSPMSGVTAPNANGIDANPACVDPERTFEDWAVFKGCDSEETLSNKRDFAYALFIADPETNIPDCVSYCRAGVQPTNEALRGTAHDSGDMGAVPMAEAGGVVPILQGLTGNLGNLSGNLQ